MLRISNKISSPFYIYTFLMVMWSCRTSPFWDLYSSTSIMTVIYLCINIYFYSRFCEEKNLRSVWIFSSIVFVWYLLSCLKYQTLVKFPYPAIYDIIIVFIAYSMMRKSFFHYYERVVSDLSLICLVVWIGIVLFPDIVPGIMRRISITPPSRPLDSNFFIFGMSSQFEEGIRRNLGFTWEPGRYSCYLLLALFANLTVNKFNITHNKNFWILFLSLLSTLSTTGYVGSLIVILYYLYNRKFLSRLVVIGILAVSMPTVLAFSFMQEKIQSVMFTHLTEKDLSHNMDYFMSNTDMKLIVPQRGMGIYVDMLDIIHDPLLGYGDEPRSYSNNKMFHGYIVQSSNGVTKIFALRGLIYGIIMYIILFASSFLFAKQHKIKGDLFLALLFIAISVSYDFWGGIFGYFAFYSLLYYKDIHWRFWRNRKYLSLKVL